MKLAVTVKNRGETLERALEQQLRALFASIPRLGSIVTVSRPSKEENLIFDIGAEFPMPGTKRRVQLRVICKQQPRPSQFAFADLSERLAQGKRPAEIVPVLAAPYISPRMAELCRAHGWSWFDLAGNCFLDVPGVCYIERSGLAPVHERPKPKANLSSAASAQVLRTLLAPENAGKAWTQTALQKNCEPGVSIGLVNKVVTHLREEAWLSTLDDGGFQVRDAVGLLEAWAKAYRFDRHRRVGYFTLLKPQELQRRLERLNDCEGEVAYAAFSAADFQAPSVRQNKTWLYVNDAALDEFIEVAEAKRVESGENLVVLIPDDDGVFSMGDAGHGGRLACTNPVQTWLDLRHAGSRGEEAAEAILNKCLKPIWEGVHGNV